MLNPENLELFTLALVAGIVVAGALLVIRHNKRKALRRELRAGGGGHEDPTNPKRPVDQE